MRRLLLFVFLALCPLPFALEQPALAQSATDYGSLDTDKFVIHNESTSLQVLPASPDAWKTVTDAVKQFLPQLNVTGIELFVRDTTDGTRSRSGFCYSALTGQLTSKDQWRRGPNGSLQWYQFMVLPANNLNNGPVSYSGNVSKGLAYTLDAGGLDVLLDNCANPKLLAKPPAEHPETKKLWTPDPLLLVSAKAPFAEPAPAVPDYDIPNGHFYTQANGQAGAGGSGYSVVDDDQATLWSEFQRVGGVAALGYPISQRYALPDNLTYQAFQKGILQWNPLDHAVHLANIFDQLTAAGRDSWLSAFKQTPPSRDWSGDVGQPWDKVVAKHLAVLDANPAIKAAYLADAAAPEHYGLPMGYADYGTLAVVRCQRAVFQQWKVATQFATTNQVLIANGGDNAKDAGLVPTSAAAPLPAPPPVLSPIEVGSSGAQMSDATVSHALGQ
ncbi:MAG TPA: hypothetical protein VIR57_11010 [Chloroflexota bacterium]